MFKEKALLIFILFLTTLYGEQQSSFFKTNYTFLDTSVNYLQWNKHTLKKTSQKSFSYIELEGGSGWKWGEFYGFLDLENPTHSYNATPTSNLRLTAKPIFDIYIKNGFNLHIQDYHLESKDFFINNLAVGISYKYSGEKGNWFTPFIASHYQTSSYYSGLNGFIGGWSFNYNFSLFGAKLALFNWHEIEFSRDKQDYQLSDGTLIGNEKSYGINGAISLWLYLNTNLKTGIQYRYAKYELGSKEFQSALIYSLKYYF